VNDKLRQTYAGLAERLRTLEPASIVNLQNEWREWFDGYGVEITDEAVDAAVAVAGGLASQHAGTIGNLPRSVKRAARAQLSTLLSTDVISTAVLASLRPSPVA
jgi:hypothetical protein